MLLWEVDILDCGDIYFTLLTVGGNNILILMPWLCSFLNKFNVLWEVDILACTVTVINYG